MEPSLEEQPTPFQRLLQALWLRCQRMLEQIAIGLLIAVVLVSFMLLDTCIRPAPVTMAACIPPKGV